MLLLRAVTGILNAFTLIVFYCRVVFFANCHLASQDLVLSRIHLPKMSEARVLNRFCIVSQKRLIDAIRYIKTLKSVYISKTYFKSFLAFLLAFFIRKRCVCCQFIAVLCTIN